MAMLLKRQSNEIFDSRFFIKRIILVSIDILIGDFELCRIFVQLFVLKISKNWLPAVTDSIESIIQL
jgi:hypothetical protein